MEILGYFAAVLIGISLGLIGGGGSILTVPVLVYLFRINPVLATTYSLFIVGATSLTGGIRYYFKKLVDFRAVWLFGLSSIVTVFLARRFLLPAIPAEITVFHLVLHKNMLLMVVFALLMLYSSWSIITCRNCTEDEEASNERKSAAPLVINGMFTGLVTGMLGAGGGFLIIPVLVLLLKLTMKRAVGTSLMIIALNSLLGFLFSTDHAAINWKEMLMITVVATIGIFIGNRLSDLIDGSKIKKIFGYFVLAMAVFILVRELVM